MPPGVKTGDTFLVRLALPIRKDVLNANPIEAPSYDSQQPHFSQTLESWLTPYPDAAVIGAAQNGDGKKVDPSRLQGAVPTPLAYAPKNTYVPTVATATSPTHESPGSETVETREDAETPKQKLLLVHIPSGLPEGSTVQVEVPGEDRTLTAQVPPGVQSFHVAYTPRVKSTASPAARHSAPTPISSPPKQTPARATSPKGQKLLLVRVPKGTPAGTTLHVSVPDEPGRILAAQVPPGNVQEFHVSYEARRPRQSPSAAQQQQQPQYQQPSPTQQQYQPPPSPPQRYQQFQQRPSSPSQQYRQQQGPPAFANALDTHNTYPQGPPPSYQSPQGSPNYHSPRQQQQRRPSPSPQNNRQNNGGGGWGNFTMPFVGGATAGAAGVATYDPLVNGDGGGGYDAPGRDYSYGGNAMGGGYGY